MDQEKAALQQQIEILKKDLYMSLIVIAGEYPAHDDRYKDAIVIAERHKLGDINPN